MTSDPPGTPAGDGDHADGEHADGGRADGQAPPDAPSWLPHGCPAWCDWSADHRENDRYADRSHGGSVRAVVLTATEAPLHPGETEPWTVRAYLRQHYREIAPRVEVDRAGVATGVVLTVDEAAEFARALLELVDIANGRAP